MKRRTFIKTSTIGTIGAGLIPISMLGQEQDTLPDAVRVDNGEPAQLFNQAILGLGGMKQFISQGDIVVIKPNIGWARAPEYAANTNPDLVAEVVKSCYNAGAKEVKVFDRTCNNPRRCYISSEIEEKAEKAGAEVSQIRQNKFSSIKLKQGKVLKEWEIYEDYLEADKVINIPIAKHHSLSHVTLGIKNLMGVMGGNRGSIHTGFDEKIADISSEILPTLTIIDAYRILTRNGPTGGNLADVKLQRSLIASSCMVTADYLGMELFSLQLYQVGHIREMVDRGINKYDLTKLNLKQIDLGS
ncbi:MAG: DUF362 domain-containing protein [Calditrichia bacterium]|nr:DUF362 domain-containing protein [Calditrichia bacterium]